MAIYKFAKEHLTGIMSHIEGLDYTIASMTPVDKHYTIEINDEFDPDQYQHLNEEYGFEEVI